MLVEIGWVPIKSNEKSNRRTEIGLKSMIELPSILLFPTWRENTAYLLNERNGKRKLVSNLNLAILHTVPF